MQLRPSNARSAAGRRSAANPPQSIRQTTQRCAAFPPEAADGVAQALNSLHLPGSVADLLSGDPAAWRGIQPHFGSRAIAGAVESFTAQAPRLPSLPQFDASAVSGALPHPPAFNLSFPVDAGSLTSAPAGLAAVASSAAASLSSLASESGSSLSAALKSVALAAPAGSLPSLEGLPELTSLDRLQPHFGSEALARGLDSLAGWAGSRFQGLELLDAETASRLTSALGELRGVAGVMTLPPALGASGGASMQQLGAAVGALAAGLRGAAAEGGAAVGALAAGPDALLAAASSAFEQAQLQGVGGYSLPTLAVVGALTALAVAASTPGEDYTGPPVPLPDDRLSHDYDPEALAAYWARRPLAVVKRSAQVAAEAASFGAALLMDMWTGRLAANERERAEQLRGIIERLGPAYVKVAQALSTRVDLLTAAYFEEIQRLQDRVPPFPCEVARAEMQKAFGGRPVEAVFASLSDRPVAAASLGQVYRGTLRPELGGEDVAVKVQRPDVLEQVSLDLLIMRKIAIAMKENLQMSTDWAAVIDAWGLRFLHEMDYTREAANAEAFAAQMAERGVEGITVAAVRHDLSSDFVLTTDWVQGEKLSESTASDVRELCNTLLNAYLIQLLDTGFLHADPHPGNLIRTPDGKICVLDFGLMTEVTPEQRLALVEYIAHLSTQDWEKLAVDLQTLGFIPPEVNPRQAGLVEPLGRVMEQLTGGGGASKVNIDKVMADLEALGDKYPIQIPAFFALILRAFSVIEGIALRVDPDYAIVAECFPYLAHRLLSDDSPRMRAVLKDVLYGTKNRIDVDRLLRVADGLSNFTTDGLAPEQGTATAAAAAGGTASGRAASGGSASTSGRELAAPRQPGTGLVLASSARRGGAGSDSDDSAVLSPVAVDALRQLLRPGSYAAELLVEELAAAVDALSREALSSLVRGVLASGPAALSLRSVEALGPLRSVLLPLPTPVEIIARMAPAVALTPEDREALGVVRAILILAQKVAPQGDAAAAGSPEAAAAAAQALARGVRPRRVARLANELGSLLPQLAPGLAYTSDLFVRALLRRAQKRLTDAAQLAVSGRPQAVTMPSSAAGRAGTQQAQSQPQGAAAFASVQPAIPMRMMGAPPSAPPRQGGTGSAPGTRGSGR
ncbi:hypothetical protein HYH03_000583 [Edaphochlamys debaryana]|uniref:Protein kinase domain-containing protein n=1 Tax=Edaphochlamys debaryana TaxID=47281 RepID=A0A836C6B6_9CHLO|nr:hypothetical protein HYH03_000583 [Edaphochlamys debaryana]|eukprot:KAG2502091.1 hypothetical protein HYH03_000583 [Edaphochlamys debaryana]